MDAGPNSKQISLGNLLVKLHRDGVSGVVTLKDDRKALRIYLRGGHVVFADGIDKDSQLLKEITAKRHLDPQQIEELKKIIEKDPLSLGKVLLEKKILSQAVWNKFLEIKVKTILTAAFEMDTADLGFSASQLDIPPVNFIDYNVIQLLLEILRGYKNQDHIRKQIARDGGAFSLSEGAEAVKGNIPLSPSEQMVLTMLDSPKTLEEITKKTGLEQENAYKILYLLLCFGLIDAAAGGSGGAEDGVALDEIINLYIDLLKIIETNFQKEIGKEFANVFEKSKGELTGQSKDLLQDLDLTRESQERIASEISRLLKSRVDPVEVRLALLSSFNKLIYLLIMQMKKVLGIGLTEKTLNEMMNILNYVEKYRQDAEMMNYVKGNLTDYLRQLKS
ncbi:MAG: DUF4388 domain-containing protein [Pseudomonadota bacterium]